MKDLILFIFLSILKSTTVSVFIYLFIYLFFIYSWLTANEITVNFLYGIEKSFLKMNTIYIGKFRYTPMINSKIEFETLVWRLIKDLARS